MPTQPIRRTVRLSTGGPIRFGRTHYTNGNPIVPDPARPGWSLPTKWVPNGERIGPYWLENSTHAMVGAIENSLAIDANDLVFSQPGGTTDQVVFFAPVVDESLAALGVTVGGSGGITANRIRFFRNGSRMWLDDPSHYNVLVSSSINLWVGIFSVQDEPTPLTITDPDLLSLIDDRIAAQQTSCRT